MLGLAAGHEPVSYWDIAAAPIRERATRPSDRRRVAEKGVWLARLSQLGMRAGGKGRGIKAGRSKVSTTWRVSGAEPPEQER